MVTSKVTSASRSRLRPWRVTGLHRGCPGICWALQFIPRERSGAAFPADLRGQDGHPSAWRKVLLSAGGGHHAEGPKLAAARSGFVLSTGGRGTRGELPGGEGPRTPPNF